MTDFNTIQLIIQGGAVGLALVVITGVYFIIRRAMEIANTFMSNHLSHLTAAVEKNTEVLEHLDETVADLSRRM